MERTGAHVETDDDPEYAERADFDGFSRWHRPRLEQWYRQRGLSPEDAADVAQEALTGLFRRWPSLATEEHRRRSYYTITRNKLTDFWRRQDRRLQPDVSLDDYTQPDLPADARTTNPDVLLGCDRHPVWRAVDRLPEARRDALLGRVVHGMSYGELAGATGRTETSLRKDVARAKAWLRLVLKVGCCLLGGWLSKVRRVQPRPTRAALPSVSPTALAVIPRGALLSLLLTSPLHVLPSRSTVVEVVTDPPRVVVRMLPGPVAGTLIRLAPRAPSPTRSRPAVATRHPLERRLRPRALAKVPTVDPGDVCLQKRCGTGERITLSVLGHEQVLPGQSVVELCWAVPDATAPHVTCSEGTEAP